MDDWVRLAFSITEESKPHSEILEYPFIFGSGAIFTGIKSIMTDCVGTFRIYAVLAAMSEAWNKAASRPFGVKDCMLELSKVSKYSLILKEQKIGQRPSNHPLNHPDIDKLITAIVNIRAIEIMSSDDALSEAQAQRRFGSSVKLPAFQSFDRDVFWGRFVSTLIQNQIQEIATLFVKIILKFSQWPGCTLGDAIREAKELLPYAKVNESTQNLVKDLARDRGTGSTTLGVASNLDKRVPPSNSADLFVPPPKADLTKLIGNLYELEKI